MLSFHVNSILSITCVLVDGKCQRTLVTMGKDAEGVGISSGIKGDDNNSTVSSSLSSSSTIATPLSPRSYHSSGLNEIDGEENENVSDQKVHVQQTDQHENQFCDQSGNEGHKQETTSRLHYNKHFQIQQFTEDGDVGFELIDNRNKKQMTQRIDQLVDAEQNKGKNYLEVQHVSSGHNHMHKWPPDVPSVGCEDAPEELSCEGGP